MGFEVFFAEFQNKFWRYTALHEPISDYDSPSEDFTLCPAYLHPVCTYSLR